MCVKPLIFSIFFCSVCCLTVQAQRADVVPEQREGFDAFVELLCDVAGDDAEAEWESEQMEDLYELYCHPLNLNDLDEAQLSQLPFMVSASSP